MAYQKGNWTTCTIDDASGEVIPTAEGVQSMGGVYYQTRCSQDTTTESTEGVEEKKIFLSIRKKRKTMPREKEKTERKRKTNRQI
jgi:hypothetical protein